MVQPPKFLIANRRVLAIVAALFIAAAALVAILGGEKRPDIPPRPEARPPARVSSPALSPVRVWQSPAVTVISLNSDVFFAFDSANLTVKARSKLRHKVLPRVLAVLKRRGARVDLNGYTDGVGDGAYNRRLSQKRADAVLGFLVAAGVPLGRLAADGFGEKRASSFRPDPGLRRVDVVLRKRGSR